LPISIGIVATTRLCGAGIAAFMARLPTAIGNPNHDDTLTDQSPMSGQPARAKGEMASAGGRATCQPEQRAPGAEWLSGYRRSTRAANKRRNRPPGATNSPFAFRTGRGVYTTRQPRGPDDRGHGLWSLSDGARFGSSGSALNCLKTALARAMPTGPSAAWLEGEPDDYERNAAAE
jgi:hypothetical protein